MIGSSFRRIIDLYVIPYTGINSKWFKDIDRYIDKCVNNLNLRKDFF